jgi:hypothetical protein
MTQPQDDVLDLWNNLPPQARGISVTGIITYLFTLIFAMFSDRLGLVLPGQVAIGLMIWPLIIVAWLLVVWLALAIFSGARILLEGRKERRAEAGRQVMKTIIFVPTVIGTALTVVDVFVRDVFSSEDADEN